MKVYIVHTIACCGDEVVVKGVYTDRELARTRAAQLLVGRIHNTSVTEWVLDGPEGTREVFGDDD